MSAAKVATDLRRQAIALRNGHAGTKLALADGLERLADSLETASIAVREFVPLGGSVPMPFQGGWVVLRGYGCSECGDAFWTESDEARALKPGTVASCPHCGGVCRVPGGDRA